MNDSPPDSDRCERCGDQPIEYELEAKHGPQEFQLCQACFYADIETITNDDIATLEPAQGTYDVESRDDESVS